MGAVLKPFSGPLWPSWGPFGLSWGVLEAFGRLGALLGASWGPLGGRLGPSWASLGSLQGLSWAVLGPSWAVLGAPWARLGLSWAVWGRSGRPLGLACNGFRGAVGRLRASGSGKDKKAKIRQTRTEITVFCFVGPYWQASWGSLGASWVTFGLSWGHPGPSWRPRGPSSGRLRAVWSCFATSADRRGCLAAIFLRFWAPWDGPGSPGPPMGESGRAPPGPGTPGYIYTHIYIYI